MVIKVLIVEDEIRMRRFIKAYFEEEKWIAYEAENGIKALDIIAKNSIDVVVLDIMMPMMDGREVIKRIRKDSNVYIIMLTALSSEKNEVECYSYGADDFITKPFKAKILVAKIKRYIERAKAMKETDVYEHQDFKIDFLAREVYVGMDKLRLSPKEFDLLAYLVSSKNNVKTRYQIIDAVWGIDFIGELRVVDKHVLKIRHKLNSEHVRINTVIGKGYKYEEN